MAKKAGEKSTEKKKTTSESTTAKKATKVKAEAGASTAAKRKVVAAASESDAKPRAGRVGGKVCKMKSCKREYRAKGYCRMHYKKWRQGAYGPARYKTCGDINCFKPKARNRHGYCEDHFQNYYVKGMEVTKMPTAAPAPAAEEKKAAG